MPLFRKKSGLSVPIAFLAVFLAAFLALPALFCHPSLAGNAPGAARNALVGSVIGKNGLAVSWDTEKDIPGKTKVKNQDFCWLVVKPVLDGKELDRLYMELSCEDFAGSELPVVEVEDYNLDGHDDIRLLEGTGYNGPFGPTYLYNPRTGQLEQNKTYSGFWVQKIDKDSKILHVWTFESVCAESRQELRVKGFDQLELLFEEGSQCPDETMNYEGSIYFRRVYKDGKIVSEETKKLAEGEYWQNQGNGGR